MSIRTAAGGGSTLGTLASWESLPGVWLPIAMLLLLLLLLPLIARRRAEQQPV